MPKIKYQIKKRFTNEIMFEGEAESFAKFVEQNNSNLSNSDLSNSNLSNSDLSNSKIKITQKDEIIKALKIEVIE